MKDKMQDSKLVKELMGINDEHSKLSESHASVAVLKETFENQGMSFSSFYNRIFWAFMDVESGTNDRATNSWASLYTYFLDLCESLEDEPRANLIKMLESGEMKDEDFINFCADAIADLKSRNEAVLEKQESVVFRLAAEHVAKVA